MSENDNNDSHKDAKDSKRKDSISIIYHQKNDSPKYFEIKRSRLFLFFIGLPTITLIAVIFGAVGIINTSPMDLIKDYRDNQKTRNELSLQENLKEKMQAALEENAKLKKELTDSQEIKSAVAGSQVAESTSPASSATSTTTTCPAPVVCSGATATANSIGLSTLSLFKPIQGQKDRTRPAVLNLSGFKTSIGRDTINLQFNIMPAVADDSKISGHIIVLMKNEIAIQAYPLQALGGNDFQINYSAGEPFATQRFRPVDAGFVKPRKSGNYSFTVFIFTRSGDLIHYQTITLPLRL